MGRLHRSHPRWSSRSPVDTASDAVIAEMCGQPPSLAIRCLGRSGARGRCGRGARLFAQPAGVCSLRAARRRLLGNEKDALTQRAVRLHGHRTTIWWPLSHSCSLGLGGLSNVAKPWLSAEESAERLGMTKDRVLATSASAAMPAQRAGGARALQASKVAMNPLSGVGPQAAAERTADGDA